jgi:hypothetical protein
VCVGGGGHKHCLSVIVHLIIGWEVLLEIIIRAVH